jgi:TonB family protein
MIHHVRLEQVAATKDSPAWGYPVSQFPMPVYPRKPAEMGYGALVLVRLKIGKDGLVQEASIMKSSDKDFEESVLFATRQWKFREGQEIPEAEPKGMILECTINFFVEDDPDG